MLCLQDSEPQMRHTTFLTFSMMSFGLMSVSHKRLMTYRHLHTKSSWTSLSIWTVWVRVWRFHCRVIILYMVYYAIMTVAQYFQANMNNPPRKYYIFIWRLHFISGEGQQNLCFVRRLRSVRREVSLSSHTLCDTGPRFYNPIRKTASISRPLRQLWGTEVIRPLVRQLFCPTVLLAT